MQIIRKYTSTKKVIIMFSLSYVCFFMYQSHIAASTVATNLQNISQVELRSEVVPLQQTPLISSESKPTSNENIKTVIEEIISDMIARGLLRGEKGDRGEPGTSSTMNISSGGLPTIQQVYIPGGAIMADGETYFSASHLSSNTVKSETATLENVEVNVDLTVAGGTNLQGNTVLATTSVSNINVGSLTSDSGAFLSNGGVWTNVSTKHLKENFATVTPEVILEAINNLPIYQWNYKKEDASVKHMGPTAEDFYEAFNLGGAAGATSISTIDPAGVALSGIQALSEKINSQFSYSLTLDMLKKLGLEISDGLVSAKQLVSELVQTKQLEVGSSEHPTGITIYDRATAQPVCIYSENNVLKSEIGKCQSTVLRREDSQQNKEDKVPPQQEELTSDTSTSDTNANTNPTSTQDISPVNTLEPITSTTESVISVDEN